MEQSASDREAALRQVAELRAAGRARPAPARVLVAAFGVLALVAAVPLVIVLPEIGVPLMLVALRQLAVEFDWAARAYAWVVWRWEQAKAWFHGSPGPVRAAVVVVLLAVGVGLLWLLAHQFL